MDYWYQTANVYHIYMFGLCNAPFANTYTSVQNRLHIIEQWIPHIKEMGCNAVYFSPVFQSKTHGYDTTDYYQIDNRIGSNENFKELIRVLHHNGLRVILDGVFNHCGRDFFAFRDISEKGPAVHHSVYLYTIYILLYTIPGIPSLYYGSEWGVKGVKSNNSDAPLRPFVDLDNVCGSEMDLKDVIIKLSRIRNENKALSRGSYKQLFVKYERQFAFERIFDYEKMVIIINTAGHNALVNLEGYDSDCYDVLNDETICQNQLDNLVVYPYWGRILRFHVYRA